MAIENLGRVGDVKKILECVFLDEPVNILVYRPGRGIKHQRVRRCRGEEG